jgi:hypothetical protein
MAGGILCDYLTSKGSQNAPLQTILLCSVFTLVFAVLAPLMPSPTACLGGLAVATFFILAPFGLAPVAIQAMTPNEMRGQISALYLFSINILGLGLGSTVVGLITDFLFQDEAKVGWSISLAIGIEVPLAILFMLIGMKKLHISNRTSAS